MIQTADLGANSGALMVHWIHQHGVRRAFINAPGTSAIWLADDDDGNGVYDFQQVLGPADGIALPVDMLLSHDDKSMYVSNWFGNTVQRFDVSDPFHPVLKATVSVPHPNMLRLSRDNQRLYVTNSLLTPWDNDPDFGAPRNDKYGIWLFDANPTPAASRRSRRTEAPGSASRTSRRRTPPGRQGRTSCSSTRASRSCPASTEERLTPLAPLLHGAARADSSPPARVTERRPVHAGASSSPRRR